MRLKRIHLQNFRGIRNREIVFPVEGVTVLIGQNEIGKSSLFDALQLVFMEKATSKKTLVKEIQPVGKDVGPFVAIDISLGPYEISLEKTYLKSPQTTLNIRGPQNNAFQGDEAHAEWIRLLESEMDLPLFWSLLLGQSRESSPLQLTGYASLERALDGSAGTPHSGETTEPLFDRVQAEYGLYFTPKGTQKKGLDEKVLARKATEVECQELEGQLRDLERDVESLLGLDREHSEVLLSVQNAQIRQKETQVSLEALQGEKAAWQRLQWAHTTALSDLKALVQQLEHRKKLEGELTGLKEEAENLRMAGADAAPALQKMKSEREQGEESVLKSKLAVEEREKTLELLEEDSQHFRTRDEAASLEERWSRIEELTQEERDNTPKSLVPILREEDLKHLVDAFIRAESTRNQLASASPSLQVAAQRDLSVVRVDTHTTTALLKGEKASFVLAEDGAIELPGIATLSLRVGSEIASLATESETAAKKLKELYEKLGVSSVQEARLRGQEQALRARDQETRKTALRDLLKNESLEEIEEKREKMRSSLASYEAARPQDAPSLVDSAEDVRNRIREGREKLVQLKSGLQEQENKVRAIREQESTLVRMESERTIRMEILSERITERSQEQTKVAADLRENALQETRTALEQKNEVRILEMAKIEENMTALGGEKIALLCENAADALQSAEEERQSISERRIALQARLLERGERGLAEQLSHKKTELHRLCMEERSLLGRAEAAKRLFTLLQEERKILRNRYMEPLRTKIEELGRILYNSTFGVELDDSLKVSRRTLDGITLPWKSLSGGAQEQMDLLVRFAVTLLVSEDGGVPLLLDETLVYTDPERRRLLGALLKRLGNRTQVILLTSDRARFSGLIGSAHSIRLDSLAQ